MSMVMRVISASPPDHAMPSTRIQAGREATTIKRQHAKCLCIDPSFRWDAERAWYRTGMLVADFAAATRNAMPTF